jgi:hypothetical protein
VQARGDGAQPGVGGPELSGGRGWLGVALSRKRVATLWLDLSISLDLDLLSAMSLRLYRPLSVSISESLDLCIHLSIYRYACVCFEENVSLCW